MGAQRFEANGIEVWCLKDGGLTFPEKVFPDVDSDTRAQRLADAGLTGIDTVFNAYLLRHPDGACDLIDTGCGIGSKFGSGTGLVASRLKALGVTPGAIRRVLLTHLHGDHAGGLVAQSAAVYPNAELFVHAAELTAYGESEEVAQIETAYAGRIHTMEDGEDLGGLTAWHLPGHTPGHTGFWIGDGFAVVADIVHSAALQLPDPDICPIYDMDPDQARATRRAALTRLSAENAVWTGSHLLGKAFVRAAAQADGFVISPA